MKENKRWIGMFLLLLFVIIIAVFLKDQEEEATEIITEPIEEIVAEPVEEIVTEAVEEIKVYTEDELWEKLKYQTVMIQGDNIFGSGSILSIDEEHIRIVSNDHLTIYVMNPRVYFFDGSSVEAVNTENAEQLDMGILEIAKEDVDLETLEQLESIQIEKSIELNVGYVVYSLGSAEGNATSRVLGTILETDEYHPEFHSFMTRCSGTVQAGMSGAGVYDLEGNYLGMVSGAKDDEFVFLPVEIMKEEVFFGGENYDKD